MGGLVVELEVSGGVAARERDKERRERRVGSLKCMVVELSFHSPCICMIL